MNKLNTISDDYFVCGSSAMTACVSAGPLVGRPFGGTAILINKKHLSSTVNIMSGDRFTAVKVYDWLMLTVYMPCVGTKDRDALYSDVLLEIQSIINDYSNCNILVGGDFNTDLNCRVNVSNAVNNFIADNQLHRCDVLYPVASKFTFFNEASNCASAVDYMLTSNACNTIGFNIIDMDINLSDHHPIMAICLCHSTSAPTAAGSGRQADIEHFRWDHAPLDLYYEHTRLLLQPVYDELVNLSDNNIVLNSNFVDDAYERVVHALRSSANMFIPKHRKKLL